MEMLLLISGTSRITTRLTRQAVTVREDGQFEVRLKEVERVYLTTLMSTHDATEGLKAFLEKRSPVWRHQ